MASLVSPAQLCYNGGRIPSRPLPLTSSTAPTTQHRYLRTTLLSQSVCGKKNVMPITRRHVFINYNIGIVNAIEAYNNNIFW